MACKMNFDWIGDVTGKDKSRPPIMCTIYTTFIDHNVFAVRIMLGKENSSPRDKPWRKGTARNCISHEEAFKRAFRWAKLAIKAGVKP